MSQEPIKRDVREWLYSALQGLIDKAYGDMPQLHGILDQWGGAEWQARCTGVDGAVYDLCVTIDRSDDAVMSDG